MPPKLIIGQPFHHSVTSVPPQASGGSDFNNMFNLPGQILRFHLDPTLRDLDVTQVLGPAKWVYQAQEAILSESDVEPRLQAKPHVLLAELLLNPRDLAAAQLRAKKDPISMADKAMERRESSQAKPNKPLKKMLPNSLPFLS
uniref:Uncharacterized protein n=1 Tax=Cannabis sativa TaxID=3483 RepID=A0A803QRH3_CANSA